MTGLTRGEFAAFDDILRIEPVQRNLLINGAVFVTTASEVQATDLADLLRRVKKRPLAERSAEIENHLTRSLDTDCICSRLNEYAEKTFALSLDSLVLFLATFIISPFVVWKWGLVAMWPFLLSYLVLNVSLIIWDFRHADRELFPNTKVTRWSAIVIILLSPPVALRATKYLAKDIGCGYHPLALAAARCSDPDFQRLASWTLRDLTFVPETSLCMDGRAADCVEWFRQRLQNAILGLVRKKGVNSEALIAPPSRESESVQSYCPRCLSQFVISEGVCTDCDGVSLRSFDLSP